MIRHFARSLISVLLGIVFVVSYAAYVVEQVVVDDLLDPDYYSGALEENRIYDRVYSELLADRAFQDITGQLLGDMRIDVAWSPDVYGYIVSALRLILPPEVLRDAVERMLLELTAYLAGNRTRLHANLDFSEMLNDPNLEQKIVTGIQSIVVGLVTHARARGTFLPVSPPTMPFVLDDFYTRTQAYMQALASGRVEVLPPEVVAFPIDQLTVSQKKQLAAILLAPAADRATETTYSQVEAALLDNDLEGAIVIASGVLAETHVREAVANLKQQLNNSSFSGVQSFAELTEQTTATIIDELNGVRELVRLARDDLAPIIIVVMALSLLGQAWGGGGSIVRVLRVMGITLMVAGLVVAVGWSIAVARIHIPYEDFISNALGHAALPESLRRMLDDVMDSLVARLGSAVQIRVLGVLGLGGLLFVVSLMPLVYRMLSYLLVKSTRHPRVALVVVTSALILVPVTVDWLINLNRTAAARPMRCNGYAALCGRRFDEVVFPATHNAMAISNLGWIWPYQDGTLSVQLEAGVRAMLIDTHYGDTPDKIAEYLATFPPSTRSFMAEIIAAADDSLKGEGTFLCHNLCSLGGMPLVEALSEIRRFLDDHPYEVLVLIIQDGITPEDTARAFEDSGLIYYVHTHYPGEPWPTLKDMIASDERLVVFAERGSPPPDWYHHFWDYAQETPFNVRSPEAFSCAPNRGGVGKPLFLLNHWVARRAPSRVDAAQVNAYDFLMTRVQTCMEERGHLPNFIAVDFYSIGDLFAVVDALNGVVEP